VTETQRGCVFKSAEERGSERREREAQQAQADLRAPEYGEEPGLDACGLLMAERLMRRR
jgi:hypothetical protein